MIVELELSARCAGRDGEAGEPVVQREEHRRIGEVDQADCRRIDDRVLERREEDERQQRRAGRDRERAGERAAVDREVVRHPGGEVPPLIHAKSVGASGPTRVMSMVTTAPAAAATARPATGSATSRTIAPGAVASSTVPVSVPNATTRWPMLMASVPKVVVEPRRMTDVAAMATSTVKVVLNLVVVWVASLLVPTTVRVASAPGTLVRSVTKPSTKACPPLKVAVPAST